MSKSLLLCGLAPVPLLVQLWTLQALANENLEQPALTYSVDASPQEVQRGAPDVILNLPELPEVVVNIPSQQEPLVTLATPPPSLFIESHAQPASLQERPGRVLLKADEAKLRLMLAHKRVALGLSPAKIEGLIQAYASTGYEAFWLTQKEGALYASAHVKGVVAAIEGAKLDGLDHKRLLSALETIPEGKIAAEDALHFDLSVSLAAYLYAHDARGGRLEPARLSPMLTPQLHLPDAQSLLVRLSALNADAVQSFLQAYQPRHAGYHALKKQLARLYAGSSQDVSPDTVKLASTGAVPHDMGKNDLENDLLVNMERWRWLPPDLGERHIIVNVPAYQLRVVSQSQIVHQTRVIVGRAETPTPVFSDVMEHLIINPSWHVPPSILRKEFLPNLAKDPQYAARKGFEVTRNGKNISVRQPPGERNALGQIKFIFPNVHSVYLHDTPGRHLFAQDARAFSHGCVRVEAPFRLAERILASQFAAQPQAGGEQALRGMVGKGERMIRLEESLPVHLSYFTLDVDENGTLYRMKDIYGHDGRMRDALLQKALPNKVSAITR